MQEEDSQSPEHRIPSYSVKRAENLEEANDNIHTLCESIETLAHELKRHAMETNDRLTALSTETNLAITKLAQDLKTIFSSQSIIYTICIVVVCLFALTVKGVIEVLDSVLSKTGIM